MLLCGGICLFGMKLMRSRQRRFSKLDGRGRLLLEKDVRQKYGDEFVVIQMPGEIVLIPIPKDPLKALREEGKKLPKDMSIADLKKEMHEFALKEALERHNPVKIKKKKG